MHCWRVLSRFLSVGIANTVLGLGIIFLARQPLRDFTANLLAYAVVVPISFWFHRDVSFRDRGRRLPAFVRYLPTVLLGYACNCVILSKILAGGANPYLAQVLAICGHVAVTFLLSRHFVFTSPKA